MVKEKWILPLAQPPEIKKRYLKKIGRPIPGSIQYVGREQTF